MKKLFKTRFRDGKTWGIWKYRKDNRTLLWADGKHKVVWSGNFGDPVEDYFIDLDMIGSIEAINKWYAHLEGKVKRPSDEEMDDLERAFQDLFPQLYQ